MSRWWLVELDDDLTAHHQTPTGAWLSIMQVSGVVSLADLAFVTSETVQAITLLPAAPRQPKKRARQKAS